MTMNQPMRLFSFVGTCWRGAETQVLQGFSLAESLAGSEYASRSDLERKFPAADGWTGHQIKVYEAPETFIRAAYRGLGGQPPLDELAIMRELKATGSSLYVGEGVKA